jgi:ammonia channel protein AmtB
VNLILWPLAIIALFFIGFAFVIAIVVFWLIVAGAALEISRQKEADELDASKKEILKDFLVNQNKRQTIVWSRKKQEGSPFGN